MNRIKIWTVSLLVVAGCTQKPEFTLNGTISGAPDDSLFVEEMTDKALEPLTTLVTDSLGRFTYSDTAANPRLLFMHNNQKEYIMLMVLGGEQINLSAEKGNVNETIRITGSPQSELVLELNRELLRATNVMDSLGEQYQAMKGKGDDPKADEWIQKEFGKLMEQEHDYIRDFIGKHPSDPANLLALSHQIGRQPVLNPAEDFDLFEKTDSSLYKKYPNSLLVKNLHRYVEGMKQQLAAQQSQTALVKVGAIVPEISLPDPEGKTQTLSSLRGKIVLLDFWASWCAPCRRENPNLVAAYKKYHSKGFEIFQVSLDKTKENWIAGIKQDGLNWMHVSDLKYWSSPVAREFGVESIPSNFLLDKDGKIIARNLRGAALDEELDKLFR